MSLDKQSKAVRLALLWFSILGGPLAWVVHLIGSYLLVPFSCYINSVILLQLVTIVTALVAATSGGIALWFWWQLGLGSVRATGSAFGSGEVADRSNFMVLAGMFMGALFFLVIVVEGLGPFFLSPCRFRDEMNMGAMLERLLWILAIFRS